ncbi:helix-turn-helix domain-containing protein [Marinilactibacillus psychrotolerans]|uniref:helix-turn-helix domain-containing protein n=1 Tax=Marinilactibacillus psychrotolerans TaxID=191770 RepID=UPI0038877FC0
MYKRKGNCHNMMWVSVFKKMKEKNISQSELAKRASINKTVISALKNGKIKKPSFDLACKIADALEISLDDLRKGKDNAEN